MPKACPYAMMKSQRLKHFFGRLLCEYLHFFGRLLCECLHFFGGLFYLGFFGGRNVSFLWGIFGGFYNFVGGIFLRNLIYYDEYETCGFDFRADGGGAAVGGSK